MNAPSKKRFAIAVAWRWLEIGATAKVRWWSERIKCWALSSCTGLIDVLLAIGGQSPNDRSAPGA
jgi:hypothetical protein